MGSTPPIERPDETTPETGPAPRRSGGVSLPDVLRTAMATALVGAALIHFAYAPVHLDDRLSHGVFFLATGWAQLALAAALLFRARPERVWLGLTALVNLAIVAVWVVSRTTGVPGSDREGVGFPDGAATALEILAVVGAAALLFAALPDRLVTRPTSFGLAGVGAVASVALVSMAVSPSFAGDHGPGGHAHEAEAANGDAHAAMDHDADDQAAAGDTWAQTRLDALAGYATPEQVERFEELEGAYLADQLRTRSDLLQGLPEAEREARIAAYVEWAVENTIELLEGAQAGDTEDMHTHGPVEWQPITDPADQVALQAQLEASAAVITQFPTVADAEAGGYRQVSPYVPGIGAHWINGDLDGSFDPGRPEMLLYNGTEMTSRIVGLSYATVGAQPPEGFVGPNDVWHAHPGLCMLGGLVVGIDGTPEELCESVGGDIARGLADLHMAHLWQVPGFESSWGLFSAENPNINVTTSDLGRSLDQ